MQSLKCMSNTMPVGFLAANDEPSFNVPSRPNSMPLDSMLSDVQPKIFLHKIN